MLNIPAERSSFYKKIILDYLSGNQSLRPFYVYEHDLRSFDNILKNKQVDRQWRKVLCDTLLKQYQPLALKNNSPVMKQIRLLEDEHTFTVTTGHQLSLFTGPFYFLIKIAHTIRLANELKLRYPGKNFIPVYWMASEDHDIDEVRSIHIDKTDYRWEVKNTGAPVGHYSTTGIEELISKLENHPGFHQIPGFLKWAGDIYKTSATVSEATFRIVHELFESHGLVVIEPDNKVLKIQLATVMHQDIFQHTGYTALTRTNQALSKAGYPLQVNGRNINFFYISAAGRLLIEVDQNGMYQIGEKKFTAQEIDSEIQQFPERFSPNVVLRPVYQEIILPNLAYVGGPGEIAYWLQLKDVFEQYHVAFPFLALRNSFAFINASLRHKWEKLGIPLQVLFEREEQVRIQSLQLIEQTHELEKRDQLFNILQELIEESQPLDNQLSSELIRFKKNSEEFFEHWSRRLRKSKENRHAKEMETVRTMRETIFPGGIPAERIQNVLHYARENDIHTLIQQLILSGQPLTTDIVVSYYN